MFFLKKKAPYISLRPQPLNKERFFDETGCSHGISILLSLRVFLFVYFRFSIIPCTFVIHQFHQLLFGYVTFHIFVYIFSSVVSIVWYSFFYR